MRKAHHFHGCTNIHWHYISPLSDGQQVCFAVFFCRGISSSAPKPPTYSNFWAKAEGALPL